MPDAGGMDLTRAVVRIEGDNSNLSSTLQKSEQLTAQSGKRIEALTYGQFKRIANAEKLSAQERWALFGKTNQVQMSSLANLEKGATRTTGGIGRLNNALFTMVRQFTGLPTAVTQSVDALGTFSLGVSTMTVAIGVVAGLAFAFDALTKSERESKKQADDLIKSLNDDALKRFLGPVGEAQLKAVNAGAVFQTALTKKNDALATIAQMSGKSTMDEGDVISLQAAQSALSGLTDAVTESGRAYAEAQRQVDEALNKENKAWAEAALQKQKEADSYKKSTDKTADAAAALDDKFLTLSLSLPKVTNGVEDMMAKLFPSERTQFTVNRPLGIGGVMNRPVVDVTGGLTGGFKPSPLAMGQGGGPGGIFAGQTLGKGMLQFHNEVKGTTKDTQILADGIVNMAEVGANAIAGFVTGAKVSFHDFVQTALAELSRLIARLLVVTALKALFTGGGAFAGTSVGKLIAGGLEARASGGPVRAGVPYLVGERGPELFVPGSSGAIAAHGSGGGAGLASAILAQLGPIPPPMSPADYATHQWVRRAFHLLSINEAETA